MVYAADREEVYAAIQNVMRKYLRQFVKLDMECLQAEQFNKENLSTVYTTLEGDYRMRLVFCAKQTLLRKIAETMLEEAVVDQKEIEACATEFFNVVCGYIVAEIFRTTNARARFHCPCYAEGYFLPENGEADSMLSFCYQNKQYDPAIFLHDQLILTND